MTSLAYLGETFKARAVVVDQLVEQLLPTSEVCDKIYNERLLSTVLKRRK